MKTDIVKKLRDPALDYDCLHRMVAANEIEELRDALQTVVNSWTSQFENAGHMAPDWVKKARAALPHNAPELTRAEGVGVE